MIIQKKVHMKLDNLMSVQSDMTYAQESAQLSLTNIELALQKFDWETLKALNENIMKVFTGIEDLNIAVNKLSQEMHIEAEQIHEFVDQFTVVEQIETDNKDAKILGYKDGSEIYSLTKTQETDEHEIVPLSAMSVEDLQKAADKFVKAHANPIPVPDKE